MEWKETAYNRLREVGLRGSKVFGSEVRGKLLAEGHQSFQNKKLNPIE